jgi:hypothetical protein
VDLRVQAAEAEEAAQGLNRRAQGVPGGPAFGLTYWPQ